MRTALVECREHGMGGAFSALAFPCSDGATKAEVLAGIGAACETRDVTFAEGDPSALERAGREAFFRNLERGSLLRVSRAY